MEIFSQLQPFCAGLVQAPDVNKVNHLRSLLYDQPQDKIQELQEYLLFPLRFILKRDAQPEKLILASLSMATDILDKTTTTNWTVFSDLYNDFFMMINHPKCGFKDISEDLKLSLILAIKSLIQSSDPLILKRIYSPDFKLSLSHSVYILVKLLEQEKFRKLKIASMDVIELLATPHEGMEDLVKASFINFLPGVSIALTHVLQPDQKEVHSVLVRALEVWTKVVVFLLADAEDKKWVETTSDKLKLLALQIKNLVSFSHWKVHMALLEWAEALLDKCFDSLNNIVTLLISVPLSFILNENITIAHRSREILEGFAEKHLNKDLILVDRICDEFYLLIKEFPRKAKLGHTDFLLQALSSFYGYFVILKQVCMSDLLIERLVSGLITLVELDVTKVTLLDTPPILADPTASLHYNLIKWPTKHFLYFHNDQILRALSQVCQNLPNVYCVIDFLLGNSESKPHCLLILNELLPALDKETLNFLVHEYLNIDPNIHEQNSPRQSKENIMKKCLILEGLAKIAQVLQDDFKPNLLKCLFMLVESIGSLYPLVSETAFIALCSIALSCGYSTLSAIIFDNMDYLINAISLKLRHHSHQTSLVLKAILTLSSSNILILLEDVIYDILRELDGHYLDNDIALNYMNVLYSVVLAIKKWHCPKHKVESDARPKPKQNFRDLIFDYLAQKEACSTEGRDEVDITQNTKEIIEEEEEESKIKELHIEVTLAILRRCIHLQQDSFPNLSLVAMDIMTTGVQVLAEKTDVLLPMVHKLWAPFVHRFHTPNLVICIHAFQTLVVLAEAAGNFLQQRVMKEVWPRVAQFLNIQSQISRHKNTTAYRHSLGYKLQLAVLSGLGPLASALELSEFRAEQVCYACAPYLLPDQPPALQKAACDTFSCLASLEPDLTWLFLNQQAPSPNVSHLLSNLFGDVR